MVEDAGDESRSGLITSSVSNQRGYLSLEFPSAGRQDGSCGRFTGMHHSISLGSFGSQFQAFLRQ